MISRTARIRSWFQIFIGVVIFACVGIQFTYGLLHTSNAETYIEQFLSFFTILSNVFVGVVFWREAANALRGKAATRSFESLRGAAAFCILTTGIIYTFFLKGPGTEGQVEYSIPLINSIFHYYVPIIAILDWIMFPPRYRMNWSTLFSWMGITIVYLILVEAAGYVVHSYPYFFVDPTMLHGYTGVVRASAGFLPFFLVFTLIIISITNFQYWVRQRIHHRTTK